MQPPPSSDDAALHPRAMRMRHDCRPCSDHSRPNQTYPNPLPACTNGRCCARWRKQAASSFSPPAQIVKIGVHEESTNMWAFYFISMASLDSLCMCVPGRVLPISRPHSPDALARWDKMDQCSTADHVMCMDLCGLACELVTIAVAVAVTVYVTVTLDMRWETVPLLLSMFHHHCQHSPSR